MTNLDEFGLMYTGNMTEQGFSANSPTLDEFAIRLIQTEAPPPLEYRSASDTGAFVDTMPYIEVQVQDSGRVVT